MGVERCGRYRGGVVVVRRAFFVVRGGVDISSGDSGGVPMVDIGDVGAVGGKCVFGSLFV